MKADVGVCCEYKDIALIEKWLKKIINKINGRKSIFYLGLIIQKPTRIMDNKK